MEHRKINDHYREIAERLIQREPALADVRESCVRIIYLESDRAKKDTKDMIVHGECEKVADKNKWAIDSDFTITVFEPNVRGFSESQLEILLFHELLHVGVTFGDGKETFYVRKHDFSDFKLIIDRFGTDWSKPQEW